MELTRRTLFTGATALALLPQVAAAQGGQISVQDSPLPNALDIYYSYMVIRRS